MDSPPLLSSSKMKLIIDDTMMKTLNRTRGRCRRPLIDSHYHHHHRHRKQQVIPQEELPKFNSSSSHRSSPSLSSSSLNSMLIFLFLFLLFLSNSLLLSSVVCTLNFDQHSSSVSSQSESGQLELIFSVTENVPVGSFIGVIKSPNESIYSIEPPFLIVPIPDGDLHSSSSTTNDNLSTNSQQQQQSSGSVDTDLNIDQSTGEIRTAIELDREQRLYYSFIAISLTGINVHVRIVSFVVFLLLFFQKKMSMKQKSDLIIDRSNNDS